MKAIVLLSCLALLATLTSGVKIQCRYYFEGWHIGSLYTCQATIISVEDPTIVTEISGNHLAGNTNADVKGFEITNHKILTTIPKGFESFFTNLEAFYWNHGNISSIDSSTFAAYPNFLSINFAHNKLVALDGDLFQTTPKLRHISIENNQIEFIGHDLLTGLTDLNYAKFGSNPCTYGLARDGHAGTQHQIQELKRQLRIKCPPLPTTTTQTTPISETCVERTKKLESELNAQSAELLVLKLENARLETWKAQAELQTALVKEFHNETKAQLKETCDARVELKLQEIFNLSNDLQAKREEINEKEEKIKQCEKKNLIVDGNDRF